MTPNVQFLSVSDSCRLEQTADFSSLMDPVQLPQSDVMRYCTMEHSESSRDQLNVSCPDLMSVRLTTGCVSEHASAHVQGMVN